MSEEEIARSEWKRFLISAVLSLPVFIISMFMIHFKFSDYIQLVLTTAVVFWPGIGFLQKRIQTDQTLVLRDGLSHCIGIWHRLRL